MKWEFPGRVAVVTGGMRGIGRTIADGLLAGGAEVHVFDRETGELPKGMTAHAVDVSNSDSVNAAFAAIGKPVHLLVNNAGITRDRTLLKMSDEEWASVITVNLTSAFNTIRAAGPGMVQAGVGRIVNMISINGLRGKMGQGNYAASKAGMVGLTKTAAKELGPKGVTCNAVAPGMVLTEMTLKLDQQFRDKALAEAALSILPDTTDIANAVLFLLSDAARCITGEVIKVDSGQYI
ncbi:3-oxoacyl- acyl-carrier protein reductase [Paramagnetospirillum magnetotacticum MS-1]|uniref:3-oxoacyl-acyl-carrier protein reductase n=1 Tax=Paramagnetospirillum magnetotacticum MS-1 TaxID=272627 RepID=A0A0C2YU18_PARME|nr:SDR family oxidoreductase [Paramagnetospirillum magnetotacticum]KIL98598.1 3-oxoacyl- acyl-carrier protein reductase [Paramagnetospirillum magnetotacticum MS-1]